jgi:outer membrane lipoprotein carrier protein
MRAVSRCFWLLTAILSLIWLPPVQAEMSGSLVQTFFNELDTLQADFHQEVRDSDHTVQQVSDGKVWIQRPGRFRWDYAAPYRQQLVSDGERLWSYDEDLEQVTVQPIGEVLSATPAMLLGGSQPIESIFTVESLPDDGNRQRALLKPKSDDSNITALLLDFTDRVISGIRAEDGFGNITTFTFSNLVRNRELDSALFRFEPPAGVDVVGEFD